MRKHATMKPNTFNVEGNRWLAFEMPPESWVMKIAAHSAAESFLSKISQTSLEALGVLCYESENCFLLFLHHTAAQHLSKSLLAVNEIHENHLRLLLRPNKHNLAPTLLAALFHSTQLSKLSRLTGQLQNHDFTFMTYQLSDIEHCILHLCLLTGAWKALSVLSVSFCMQIVIWYSQMCVLSFS